MDNGDATQGHAMTSAEFAKLMGAYPQPAENPLPAYGGYMDNSPANFSFVEFNDYFGAETEMERYNKHRDEILEVKAKLLQENEGGELYIDDPDQEAENDAIYEVLSKYYPEVYGAETHEDDTFICQRSGKTEHMDNGFLVPNLGMVSEDHMTKEDWRAWDKHNARFNPDSYSQEQLKELGLVKEAPYAGAGSLFGIGQNTGLEGFTTSELTTSSAIHGDFDEASLNYSGHQNLEVRAENLSREGSFNIEIDAYIDNEDELKERGFSERDIEAMRQEVEKKYKDGNAVFEKIQSDELDIYYNDLLENDSDVVYLKYGDRMIEDVESGIEYSGDFGGFDAETFNGLSAEEYYAEMEELTDGVASITNRFGDGVGIIQVDDEDLEDVSVEITDGDGDVVYEGILGEDVPEMEEDDFYYTENKKNSSILPMALGVISAVFAYQPVMDFLSSKYKKEEKMAETPELIENPNTGNLDPAQYEELVVESTGYAVDVIPQGLDGSFMGSRFAALPTERYVEYNEPGIGAHTDIALSRDEMYLEHEMAMVQASESVNESQAPGQSPYNSMTGEENADFDMRVLKETEVVSLDPAVKPFIPQSMSGYTGNANTPPSVFNKMFNVGVLGQTPAFVPGSGDIGSSHTGSRIATPNALGLGGSVGGPLSDQVNASYTDGTTSMSLAQWAIENTVSQTSDTEAVVIDRSSGQMKRVRRV